MLVTLEIPEGSPPDTAEIVPDWVRSILEDAISCDTAVAESQGAEEEMFPSPGTKVGDVRLM